MVRYLFYTIGDLTYQSPLVVYRHARDWILGVFMYECPCNRGV